MNKATFQQVKDFFGTERPVTNAELMEFQKQDPEGFTRLREELAEHLDKQKEPA